jgi:dolichol-phosphate mannosyltransferase
MNSLVIIPTYQEARNIESLILTINNLYLEKLDILIIDDNSPDQTAQVVKKLQSRLTNLYLIERPGKLGLGTAYIQGFQWALARNYEFIIQMDADFSHDPKYLPDIMAAAKNNDFVIGSRKVRGGGTANWPWWRQALSRGGNWYARTILGVNIRDFTAGFTGWHAGVLQQLELDQIKSIGYSFAVELKYQAVKKGFSWQEVPIVFKEREQGQSKMSTKIALEAILMIPLIRLKSLISQKK